MVDILRESLERSCRLCAEEQEVTIMMFSQEAESMLLQNKISKYLHIEVQENDQLPKNICLTCSTKLHTMCDFVDTAHKAQDVLTSRFLILKQTENKDTLLQTSIECNLKIEPNQNFDEESMTAMEVSVDPLVVLQNSQTADMLSPNIDENWPANDITYLHGLENENVTIKLIKKAEIHNREIDSKTEEQVEATPEKKRTDPNSKCKPFPCVICKRGFLTELALKNHAWIHFNDDKTGKQFKCYSCLLSFDYKCDLISHMKSHRSSGTCKLCKRVFRSEENLRLHMESHDSPANAYMCKVCGRAYNSLSNLKTHAITHSNERPYQCHLCKKSFKRNQDLKFHINQHTGAKPYQCPFCEKSFASSGNCYSHRSRMHPGRRLDSKSKIITPHGRSTRSSPRVTKPVHGPIYEEDSDEIEEDIKPDLTDLKENEQELLTERNYAEKKQPELLNLKGIYKYKCNICNHSFMRRDNFNYHMYRHSGIKPYKCELCPVSFVTLRGLSIHQPKAHPNIYGRTVKSWASKSTVLHGKNQ